MKIAINTPNGNIGRAAALALLDAGHALTVISRDPARAEALAARGARVVEGSIEQPEVVAEALAGADALLWVAPTGQRPDDRAWGAQMASQAARLAAEAGVARVVVISSVGAQHPEGNGPVDTLHGVELAFNDSPLPSVAVLRPGFFMENHLRDLGSIAAQGVLYSAAPPDTAFPMVATADIAAVAVEALTDATWSGRVVRGVHGPVDLTVRQAVAIIAEGLGRPVTLVPLTIDQLRAGMLEVGMPPFMADTYAALYAGFHAGTMDAAEARDASTTTPTTFEAFVASVLRPAFEALSA